MATLEKIRSKSVILFTVIIVALLAFILGDAFTSSRSFFGPGTTAAKVADRKIDIQEFNRQVEQQREALQAQGMTNVDHAMIQNQVLQQMLFKEILDKEIDELGITVTDSELSSAMTGANPLATVTQTVRQMGFPDAASFYDYAFNPAKYNVPANYAPQLQAMWINLENQVSEQLRQQKLGSLFSGALTANKLDAKSYYDENATTAKVRYAKKDLSTIADSAVTIMNSDLANIYNSRKSLYELAEETRPIDYIVVDIVPSEEDYLAAQKEVEDALVALREQPSTEGVSGNLNFVVNRKSASEGKLATNVKNELETLRNEGVKLLSFNNDKYTIAKLVNTFDDVDDVTIEYVAVTAPAAQRDSVIALLNGGADFDALVEQGLVQGTPQEETVSLLDNNYASFKDVLLNQPTGTYFIPEGSENSEIAGAVKVVSRTAPQPIYDIAEITYVVEPSNTTINKLSNELSNYLVENNTAETFRSSASVKGMHIFSGYVTPSSLSIANYPDTRSPAKWAMNAKKGEVSGVFGDEQSGRFIAIAVKDIYDGYTPMSDPDLSRQLALEARNAKKGEMIMADIAGKANTIDEYAAVLDSPVDTTEITFGQRIVRGFPVGEPVLLAEGSVTPQGKIAGPFATDNSVVVMEVIGTENVGREFDYDNDAMMFNQQYGAPALSRNLFGILLGRNKITNNLQRFYAD